MYVYVMVVDKKTLTFFLFCTVLLTILLPFFDDGYLNPLFSETWPINLTPSQRRLETQILLDKWDASEGPHPLCAEGALEEEVQSLAQIESETAAGPFALAGLTVLVHHPALILNALKGNVSKMLDKMRTTWLTQEQYLLIPFSMDYVFLFSANTGLDCELLNTFADLGWTRIAPLYFQGCSGNNSESKVDASGIYKSARGTRIVVRGREFPLPRYLSANMDVLQNNEWLNCGVRRDLSYVLSQGAYTHHVLDEPLLDTYGAYMKLDLDSLFVKTPPDDPRVLMQTCTLAYIKLYPYEICNTGAHEALQLFSKLTSLPIASRDAPWFQERTFFYSLLYMVQEIFGGVHYNFCVFDNFTSSNAPEDFLFVVRAEAK